MLTLTGISDLFREFFWWTSHRRLLARVRLKLSYRDPLLGESELNILETLLCVKSDLDTTCAFADSLHVIFVECNVDNIFCARHLLNV